MFQLPPFLSPQDFTLFTLVLGRLAGMFSALPLFGGERVPLQIRVVTIFAMTLVLYPVLKVKHFSIPADFISLALVVAAEVLIGVTLGLVVKVVLGAVEFCGQIIGMQMGFSISSLFDPTMGQIPLMSLFQTLLAMLLFLTLGVHHDFIRAIAQSYAVLPIGGWHMSGSLLAFLVTTTSGLFVLGIKLAAPVIVALLATTVALGVMARSFPQMNVFMISMPLTIGIGFIVLGMSLVIFMRTLHSSFADMLQQLRVLLNLLS